MEDFVTLMKRGVIYDGCPIVTKGTIRIQNGDISIDTIHNQMLVDGKNFASLCEGGNLKNEQGDIMDVDELPEIWKTKIAELTSQNEQLTDGLKKNVESLRMQLDSARLMLEEKEEKLRELQLLLADREAKCRMHEAREKEALMVAEGLKDQVTLLEEERTTEKENSAVLLEDFNEWRNNSEEEISQLKQELERRGTAINTLTNELEVANLEDQHTISALQKENQTLKAETQETPAPKKVKSQTSIKNLLKGISKKDKEGQREKKERKESTRGSIASAPHM